MKIGIIFWKLFQAPKPMNYKNLQKNIPVTRMDKLNFRYFAVCELFRLDQALRELTIKGIIGYRNICPEVIALINSGRLPIES